MTDEQLTGAELRSLLRRADRAASWLARQTGVTPTQVARWLENGVPIDRHDQVRELLPPSPGRIFS